MKKTHPASEEAGCVFFDWQCMRFGLYSPEFIKFVRFTDYNRYFIHFTLVFTIIVCYLCRKFFNYDINTPPPIH